MAYEGTWSDFNMGTNVTSLTEIYTLNDGSYGLVEHCINANGIFYLLQFVFGQGTYVEEIEFYIYDSKW